MFRFGLHSTPAILMGVVCVFRAKGNWALYTAQAGKKVFRHFKQLARLCRTESRNTAFILFYFFGKNVTVFKEKACAGR